MPQWMNAVNKHEYHYLVNYMMEDVNILSRWLRFIILGMAADL